MENFAHVVSATTSESVGTSDIFYILASVFIMVIGIVVAVVAFYFTRILKNVFHISETVRDESRRIVHDVDEVRRSAKRSFRSISWSRVFRAMPALVERVIKNRKKQDRQEESHRTHSSHHAHDN